jgi:hypothetical protein
MQAKLTLRLDEALIRKAKRVSARSGKSVSRLVADYITLLDDEEGDDPEVLTDRVRALVGIIAGSGLDEADHRAHLEAKHR